MIKTTTKMIPQQVTYSSRTGHLRISDMVGFSGTDIETVGSEKSLSYQSDGYYIRQALYCKSRSMSIHIDTNSA